MSPIASGVLLAALEWDWNNEQSWLLALIALVLAIVASALLRIAAVMTRGVNQIIKGLESIDDRLAKYSEKR